VGHPFPVHNLQVNIVEFTLEKSRRIANRYGAGVFMVLGPRLRSYRGPQADPRQCWEPGRGREGVREELATRMKKALEAGRSNPHCRMFREWNMAVRLYSRTKPVAFKLRSCALWAGALSSPRASWWRGPIRSTRNRGTHKSAVHHRRGA
jgi:hypothetical protein